MGNSVKKDTSLLVQQATMQERYPTALTDLVPRFKVGETLWNTNNGEAVRVKKIYREWAVRNENFVAMVYYHAVVPGDHLKELWVINEDEALTLEEAAAIALAR